MKKQLIIIAAALIAVVSCTEPPVGSTPMDNVKPGPVTEVVIKNVPGGADISYNLPADEDLLYVKALYKLENGKDMNVQVSMYEDTLKVRGYANNLPHDIDIVTCDRSGNESDPVSVTINPEKSPIYAIIEGMQVIPAFGGVALKWENPTESAISVTLLRSIAKSPWEEMNTYYSNSLTAKQTARGMEAVETDFAVFVRDRWENTTDTLTCTVTPFYEEQLKPGTYKKYAMKGDSEISYGWDLGYALDGDLTQAWGWFSMPTVEGGNWPAQFTMRIEGGVSLSRVRIIQRHPEMWENGNPKVFTVWGSNNPSADGSYDSWTPLKTFTSVKPSGYESGQYSDEDKYVAENGEDFEFDPEFIAPYEYYRFEFLENWGGDNTFINLYEVLFWGQMNE